MQQMFMDLGKSFVDTFSTDATGALMDWVDGTKTAGEAFQDFVKGILRGITEIMTRWLIMQAVTGIMSAAGAGISAGAGGSSTIRGGAGGGYGFHKGGIVGVDPAPVRIVNPNVFANAKRLHSGGLASDEVPAILKKNEGVFTEGQMAKMGTQINTTVNVDDERLATKLQHGIEQKVREILREEMR